MHHHIAFSSSFVVIFLLPTFDVVSTTDIAYTKQLKKVVSTWNKHANDKLSMLMLPLSLEDKMKKYGTGIVIMELLFDADMLHIFGIEEELAIKKRDAFNLLECRQGFKNHHH